MSNNRSIQIPDSLRQYIKHVWVINLDTPEKYLKSLSVFADGYPGIFFHQSDSELFLDPDKKELAPTFLFGQTVKPISLNTERKSKMIVLTFFPHVLKPLFRFNAKEVTDQCIDLKLLSPAPRIHLDEQLFAAASTNAQIAILFGYVRKLVEKSRLKTDSGLQFATSEIINLSGDVSLKKIQTNLNVSERTFERKFEEHVGISAKLFSKIQQFQASLKQLRTNRFDKLSDIAYENGYADQSHFNRTFKRFTGLSPMEFQKQPDNFNSTGLAGDDLSQEQE
jgi:AraC-like DNA-binding protein